LPSSSGDFTVSRRGCLSVTRSRRRGCASRTRRRRRRGVFPEKVRIEKVRGPRKGITHPTATARPTMMDYLEVASRARFRPRQSGPRDFPDAAPNSAPSPLRDVIEDASSGVQARMPAVLASLRHLPGRRRPNLLARRRRSGVHLARRLCQGCLPGGADDAVPVAARSAWDLSTPLVPHGMWVPNGLVAAHRLRGVSHELRPAMLDPTLRTFNFDAGPSALPSPRSANCSQSATPTRPLTWRA